MSDPAFPGTDKLLWTAAALFVVAGLAVSLARLAYRFFFD